MRALAALILGLGLAVSPAVAGTGGAADSKDSAAKGNDNSAAKTSTESTPAAAANPATPASPSMENQLQQLRDLLEAQSRQLQAQNEQLKEQQRKMHEMEEQMKNVSSSSLVNEGAIGGLGSNPAGSGIILATPSNQEKKDDMPTSIHFKGVTLTPGGFFVAESVWRQHGITNDVNTDFRGVPLPGQSASKLSELNFSGRQSRLSIKGEGKLANVKLTGYFEGDFLSAGVTSNNNESNSYTFRQRQFWGQAAFESGWKFTGGQMWSLVTETKKGLDNLTENTPLTIDAQYTVGFSWARQYGFRVTKNLGDRFWLGMSVEGPQTTLAGKIQNNTTLIAAPGDTGGLYNNQSNYSYNQTPDFVVKAAWEPGFGHYEVFGVVSTFRARVFPCANANALNPCSVDSTIVAPSVAGAFNDTKVGGGIGANARWSLFSKKFDLGLHFLGGDGVGRYGTTTLADVTVHPDGTLEPIHSYQGLGSIELHPTPKFDIYGYAGAEYAARTAYTTTRVTAAGPPPVVTTLGVGYGSPLQSNGGCLTETVPGAPGAGNQNLPGALTACQQDNRILIEGTLGYWYRFYQGPKGRLQVGMQYSYVTRNTWAANTGGDPHGIDNMFFTSFRYYLP